jgi:hypothetical protein
MNENPWISMWVRPRETIREIIARNPNRSLWPLAFIYGFSALLNCFQSVPIALQFGLFPMFLFALILAPFWGYAFFGIWSWVIVFVGRLLKGQANFQMARAAYAWSCVPLIVNIPLWILLVLFYSQILFFGVQDQIVVPGAVVVPLFLILIGKLVFSIWSLVIYLQALAEVQQFSVLRAIGNVILASLVMGITVAVLWIILMNIAGVPIAALQSSQGIAEQFK